MLKFDGAVAVEWKKNKTTVWMFVLWCQYESPLMNSLRRNVKDEVVSGRMGVFPLVGGVDLESLKVVLNTQQGQVGTGRMLVLPVVC